MPLRTIIYNFIKEQAEIIKNLVEREAIDIVEWFCYPPHGTVDIKEFADVRYRLDEAYGDGEKIYDEVFQSFPVFADMHQRRFPYFQNTIYDTWNDFNTQFGVVHKLLIDTKPDLVLFGNIPHGGHDFLLYKVAKALGIRTLILFQIPICPRFMILEGIEDFGDFCRAPNGTSEKVSDPPVIATPVYMSNVVRKQDSLKKTLRKIRDPGIGLYALIQRARYNRYKVESAEAVQTLSPDFSYIYFPLHLQPEMTTSAIGGIYSDQLLAIERLARKIPDDVQIVVKENPKQTEFQRSQTFYRRLKMIPNVVLITANYNTYDLIKGSEFVATITGTAGWEAINMGKPALVFGKAWYESLPGVFKYDSSFDFDKMKFCKISKTELVLAYRRLMCKSWPGIVQSAYFKLVPGTDVHENNLTVSDSIEAVMHNPADAKNFR